MRTHKQRNRELPNGSILDVVEQLEHCVKNLKPDRDVWDVSEVMRLDVRIRAILCDLRSFRNSLLNVNSLPNEILSVIIRFAVPRMECHGEWPPSFEKAPREHPTFRYAIVCRRWHAMVLSDPLLWSDICVYGDLDKEFEFVATSFIRAKGAPVSLHLHSTSVIEMRLPSWVRLLNSRSFHIRPFHMHYGRNARTLGVLKKISLPRVEYLTLSSSVSLPPRLRRVIGNNLPQLRHLTLSYFASWPPGVFANLLSLELNCLSGREILTLSALLDLLDASPLLQALRIWDHGPIADDSAPARTSTLSHLSMLYLEHCHSHILLPHLKVQPTTYITVQNSGNYLDNVRYNNDNFLMFFQMIPGDIGRLGMSDNIDTFQIAFDSTLFFTVRGRDGIRLFLMEDLDEYLPVARHDPTILAKLLFSLRRHPMFVCAKQLAIRLQDHIDGRPADQSDFSITVEDWKLSFFNLQNLERLVLHECVTWQLLLALKSGIVDEDGSTSWTMICPRLYSIRFEIYIAGHTSPILLLERLAELVEARSKGGCPLRRLHIRL